jgi:predicted kinase
MYPPAGGGHNGLIHELAMQLHDLIPEHSNTVDILWTSPRRGVARSPAPRAGHDLDVSTVYLPDPALVLLVGAAGAGKSTFALRHFAADEIVSSDAIRAQVSGDEGDQSVSRLAFAILHREVARRLAAGRTAVVDATNAHRGHRRSLVRRAAATGTPAVAVVLALPTAVVLARNAGRARRVHEDVVLRQLAGVAAAARRGGLAGEGFALVWVGRTVEAVDAVRFERVARRPSARPRRDEDHCDPREHDPDRVGGADPLAQEDPGEDHRPDRVERREG